MISGAMIMGPLAAWLLKKFDNWVDGKVRPGFEMFVDNFSLGIIGAVLTILAYISIGPAIQF
jgi:mannitol PTS system EIICBA or EIICB component